MRWLISFFVLFILALISIGTQISAEKTADDYFNDGKNFYIRGQYNQAIKAFSQAIDLNPHFVEAYIGRGSAYAKPPEKLDLAISDFEQAIKLDPNSFKAYTGRATIYGLKDMPDKAISDYTNAIKINPNHVAAYGGRATAYVGKGEYDKAWEDVHKAQSLGLQFPREFIEYLQKASGRKK